MKIKKIQEIICTIYDVKEYIIEGRLLGVCTNEEKQIIEQNYTISNRIYTKNSITLIDVVSKMLEISNDTSGKNAGNIIIAIKKINNNISLTKKLFITSPIVFIVEEDINITYSKIEATCENGMYLMLKNKEGSI